MNKEEDNDMKVEHFNAWTIKGLERDAVIIFMSLFVLSERSDIRKSVWQVRG